MDEILGCDHTVSIPRVSNRPNSHLVLHSVLETANVCLILRQQYFYSVGPIGDPFIIDMIDWYVLLLRRTLDVETTL